MYSTVVIPFNPLPTYLVIRVKNVKGQTGIKKVLASNCFPSSVVFVCKKKYENNSKSR